MDDEDHLCELTLRILINRIDRDIYMYRYNIISSHIVYNIYFGIGQD